MAKTLDELVALAAKENIAAEAKVKAPKGEDLKKLADHLKSWSKGKPIVRQTSDATFWRSGKWMTKLSANEVNAIAKEGYGRLSGDAKEGGATLIMNPKEKAPAKNKPLEEAKAYLRRKADRKASAKKPDAVAKARATRHAVKVNGKEYPSSFQAFKSLRLPVGRHNRFRLQLKAAGKATFEAGKRIFMFSLVK